MLAIGARRWVIADGYIPEWSQGPAPEFTSHEAACILNAGASAANVRLTVFFEDRDPVEYALCGCRRVARCTSVWAICVIRSRSRRASATRTWLTPTCRSSCSTRVLTRVRPRTP